MNQLVDTDQQSSSYSFKVFRQEKQVTDRNNLKIKHSFKLHQYCLNLLLYLTV
jgi:hypothetical protein